MPTGSAGGGEPFRVMVVDDSAVIRGLITRSLETDSDIRVVASVANGQMAINTLQRQPNIDVIVLDIEMPVLDGISALPHLLKVDPNVKIVMASTLTAKGADVSLRAMRAGAADYIAKPSSTRELTGADNFKRELTDKVKALGHAARRADPRKGTPDAADQRPAPRPFGQPAAAPIQPTSGFTLPTPIRPRAEPSVVTLRPAVDIRPEVIAIGSSTGGPQALFEVLQHLKAGVNQPILITQHMPATFTTILAEHITRQCGVNCAEAKDGEPVVAGRAYVAPGDFHMLIVARNGVPTVQLTKDPPENFCRPSVDPMLRSIVRHWGRKVLAVILTGMGHDGRSGCEQVVQAGGMVVGQDEASSVVWGMPGAVATAGLCSAVIPLKEIGPHIRKIALRQAA